MSDQRVPISPQSLWQGQPSADGAMPVDELRRGSRRLTRAVRRRNLREYVAAAFVVPAMGWLGWRAPFASMRVGSGLIIAATIFVVYYIRRHGTAKAMPADMGTTSCVAFLRAELERQRDLLRSVWKWYLLPFAPGFIFVYLGPVLAHPELASRAAWPAAGTVLVFVFIGALNRYGAKRLQARIDALERSL
jgi:hypothetical protein